MNESPTARATSDGRPADVGLTLLTPTYGPDLELCTRLVRSVREYVAPELTHLVLPDARDLALFRPLAGGQVQVMAKEEFIPAGFRRLPRMNGWVHPRLRRPVGGWLMQQIVKLNATRLVDTRGLLFADSDVAFVRPVTAETFVDPRTGDVRTYRLDDAVTAALPSHLEWTSAAEELLALPHAPAPLPDYISQLVCWDGRTAEAMLQRIEHSTGRPWHLAVAARRQVSEYLLYGTYADRSAAKRPAWVADTSLCHSYWDAEPLGPATVDAFIAAFPADFVAVGLQSFSGTADAMRSKVLGALGAGALTATR